MSNYLALRSSATPSFTVSTLTGSTITAKVISLQSTTVSIGQSTNQAYTNFTSGSFSSTLMTSTLTSYNSLSTVTKVSMNQDGRFQYALQSVPSTANYYQLSRSSDTGLTWNTLNTSTMGLPQGSLAYQSTVSGFPTYSNISQSATGQYALASVSGGQLYVSNNASSATPVYTPANVGGAPYAYLPMDSLPITDMMGNTITTGGSPPLTTTRKVGTAAINLLQTGGGTPSQYLNIPWTGAANFTISFWFNPQNVNSTFQYVCSAYSGRINIQINSSNQFYFVFPSGGLTNTTSIAGPTSVLNNTWYHVVAIFQTGGTCSLYVNSTFYGSVTNTSGVGINTTTQISLGSADNALLYAFSGYIDDFRLYNFAAPNVMNPFIYLPLDGNVVDAMGNVSAANLTATGGPAYIPGIVGTQAIYLANTIKDTPVHYITSTWTYVSTFSVSFWFNMQTVPSGQVCLFGMSNASSFSFQIAVDTGAIYINTLASDSTYQTTAAAPISANTWYYVTAIYQQTGSIILYLNNVLISSITAKAMLNTPNRLRIGAYPHTTGAGLNGYIDDFRFYNYTVSVSPIAPMNWSHTAVSGTGQYMMAACNNGGVFYSTTYGASWSQLTATQISSLVGTGGSAKTLMGPIIQPNNAAATAATWSANGVTWTASASSYLPGSPVYLPYWAFDNTTGSHTAAPFSRWVTSSNGYSTSGNSSGVTMTIQGIGSVTGDWIQLQSSVPLVMYSYTFWVGYATTRLPKTYYIVGSNDGTTWSPVQYASSSTTPSTGQYGKIPATLIVNWSGGQTFDGSTVTTTVYSTTPNAYTYFRLVVLTTYYSSGTDFMEFGEWYINFATPMPLLTAPATAPSTATSPVTVSPQMTNLAAANWSTPNGVTWTVSASTTISTFFPYKAFDNTLNSSWNNTSQTYTTTTNTSGVNTTASGVAGQITGDYIQLQSSVPLVIQSYQLATGGGPLQIPSTFYIVGSNDNSTWFAIQKCVAPSTGYAPEALNTLIPGIITVATSGSQTFGNTSLTTTTYSTTTNAYTYFRIIGTTTFGTTTYLEIGGWFVNFTAYTPNPVNALAITNGGQNMLVAATGTTMPNLVAATSNNWTANGVNWVASSSSAFALNGQYIAFNTLIGNGWPTATASYTSGTYAPTTTYGTVVSGLSTIYGEYLQIQGSAPLVMYSYMFASGYLTDRLPKTYYIVGSNDGITWYPIQYVVGSTTPNTAAYSLVPSNILVNYTGTQILGSGSITTSVYSTTTNAYSYFRIITLSIYHSNTSTTGFLEIGKWFINFQAGSTYLSTNYGSTWSTVCTAPPNAPILATSGNGLYTITGTGQLATVYSNAALTAYTIPTLTGITANINCASISSSGQNMIILTQGTTNNVFYSTNFGVTFTGMTVGTLPMTSCAMSADGNEIMVSNAANVWTLNRNTQGFSITMGNQSGLINQGQNSIAIGNLAGVTNQSANSIILNASGAVQDAYNPGFFVSPILSQATSTQSSVALLGYGADNQVVQTGMSVRADGTLNPFNVNSTGNVSFAGNVGIGLTNPTAPLHIYAPASTVWPFTLSYSSGPQLVIGNSGTSIIALDTYNTVMGTRPALCLNPSGGYVGIGLANPLYPLHVMGAGSSASSSAINYTGSYYIQPTPSSGSAAATSSGTINGNVIGIFSYYAIVSAVSVNAVYFSSYSDVRIKKNIQPLQYSALPLIEQFRIVSYDHVDKRNKPCGAGVIGQEMEAIFPSCIEKDAKVVPNIYERGVHTLEEDIICIRLISQDDQPVFKTDADILNSKKISLRVVKQDKKEHIIDCDLLETDGAVFKVEKWDDYTADDLIFVYGTEVPDFLTVDKHMLSMIGLKGIQELSEKATSQASLVQELAVQTVQLAAENTQLKSAIAAQASAMALLEARLAALESK